MRARVGSFPATPTAKPACSPIAELFCGDETCLEFRPKIRDTGKDVTSDRFRQLLEERGCQVVIIGDHPERPFQTFELTADWTLIRFHYGHRGRRGNYSESELEEWRGRIANWRQRFEVFAYFNNDWEGFAVRNALWLERALG